MHVMHTHDYMHMMHTCDCMHLMHVCDYINVIHVGSGHTAAAVGCQAGQLAFADDNVWFPRDEERVPL